MLQIDFHVTCVNSIDNLIAECYPRFRIALCNQKGMTMIQQVSDFEFELMKIIWTNGGAALYAEIVEGLERKRLSTTKNTIISLLLRLIEKGFLKTNKIGRRNKYTALVSEAEYRTAQTETFLDKIYEGDAKDLVSKLIQRDLISADEYEDLKNYWKGGNTRE